MRLGAGSVIKLKKVWVYIFVLFLLTSGIVIISNPTSALTNGDFEYQLINGDAEVEIIWYNGIGGDVTIPDTIEGKPVTSIGDWVFSYCNSLTSVTIPDSVTSIGNSAFSYCNSLTSVTIPEGVTVIEVDAFSNCISLISVTIGNNVESIGDSPFYRSAFYNCPSLTSIFVGTLNQFYCSVDGVLYNKDKTALIQSPARKAGDFIIPDGVEYIGIGAFSGCTSLTSVTIPDSVTSIGNSAFSYCSSLTSVTIPDSVAGIGVFAFYRCISLTSINIPNSVTNIGGHSFSWCTSLTSVTIPEGVKYIGYETFYHCTSLTSLIIPNSVISIGDFAFTYCTSLTSVTIPENVTDIGHASFGNCSSLISINISKSVSVIDRYAFSFCISLGSIYVDDLNKYYSSVDGVLYNKEKTTLVQYPAGRSGEFQIPDSVNSIGDMAFSGCSFLTSLTINNNITSIEEGAFPSCVSLTAFLVEEPNQYYSSIDGVLYNKEKTTLVQYPAGRSGEFQIPDSVNSIGDRAFYGCILLTSVTIPNSATNIMAGSFYGCTSLTSILVNEQNQFYSSVDGVLYTKEKNVIIQFPPGKSGDFKIPDSVTSIIDRTFSGCTFLTSVTIPESVTYIESYTFSGCTSLTSVAIPDSVTMIEEFAFSGCTSLTSFTIGRSVRDIQTGVFYQCNSLTSIFFLGDSPNSDIAWTYGHNKEMMIYYQIGASGFATPLWQGIPTYPLVMTPVSPQILVAVAGDGFVHLTWDLPSSEVYPVIDYYVVYVDGVVYLNNVTKLNINITGLNNGQNYSFEVVAHNPAGFGERSSMIYATPLEPGDDPTYKSLIDNTVFIIVGIAAVVVVAVLVVVILRKRERGGA